MNNHTIYANDELENWVEREGLIPQEQYLLDKYITGNETLIEAGTGGGRISLELKKKYENLNIVAFDFVEEMINRAKRKSNNIDFRVADATDLSWIADERFDTAIYLQQIISLIPDTLIPKAIDEAYRVLKNDGIAIFSFLYYDGRKINPLLSLLVNIIRKTRGERWQKHRLPWLKLSGKINYKLFSRHQAMTHWFDKKEIVSMLETQGFTILETVTSKEIEQRTSGSDGMLYIVCKKQTKGDC